MKTDIYESIRFHALYKRRPPVDRMPTRLIVGGAALALMLVAYSGSSRSATETTVTRDPSDRTAHTLENGRYLHGVQVRMSRDEAPVRHLAPRR